MRKRIRRTLTRLCAWWDCRRHRCSYYWHYLAHGPAELTHAGYHAAERHCSRVQGGVEKWLDQNPGICPPNSLERQAEYWERKVRA